MNRVNFQTIIDKTCDTKNVIGCVICISHQDEVWVGSAGNMKDNQPYFIASTTKLYVTALVLHYHFKGTLNLDDKVSKWLPADWMNQLHIYKGIDYSQEITIRHLLSQTSGLPDYFEDRHADGKILFKELLNGNDQEWDFLKVLHWSKQISPRFKPGQKGKAHYSDTNFQLLEQVLEKVTGKKLEQLLDEIIFNSLELKQTYLYHQPADTVPVAMNYKNRILSIPLAMKSVRGDGGIVSTAHETMIFLKAFFSGFFFPKDALSGIYLWNPIMFPLEYGVGVMRFKLPRLFSPFQPLPELIGHSGISGAFAFYNPENEVYLTGTVNQIHNPGNSFRLMMKVLSKL